MRGWIAAIAVAAGLVGCGGDDGETHRSVPASPEPDWWNGTSEDWSSVAGVNDCDELLSIIQRYGPESDRTSAAWIRASQLDCP